MDSQVGVVSGIGVSPHVPHPHVVTGVRQNESQALVNEISQPISWAAENAVLQEKDSSWNVDWETVSGGARRNKLAE